MRSRSSDQALAIETRIRRALKIRTRTNAVSDPFSTPDPRRSEQHKAALRLIDERADLVAFTLSSRLKGVGRIVTLAREGLRRGMFEVLFRQTEFNRASGELLRGHDAQLEALRATARAQVEILAESDERLDALEARLTDREANRPASARPEQGGLARSGLTDLEYLSFTDRSGDTSEERRERLRRFVPRFEGRTEVIDAGCGRGEFLQLLKESGIVAVGVDSDEAMVARCRELGFDAVQGDIVEFLRGRPEQAYGGIFAAHLIEHLERDAIVELTRLAYSRLRPGGVLVAQTVNPMCLLTHASFHGDLTGVTRVPPLALQWLAEACGFISVTVEHTSQVPDEQKLKPPPESVRVEAEAAAFNRGVAAANELLFGFQEYALIAHKSG